MQRAVLFLLVKDEADIIGHNLRHHYALGFRKFFILDNGSTDETAEFIKKFRLDNEIAQVNYIYDPVIGYYQANKMKALEAYAKIYLSYEKHRPEWLFVVDADEFITCGLGNDADNARLFNDALNDTRLTMIVFHWVQCASAEPIQSLTGDIDVFDVFPATWPTMKVAVSKVAYRLGKNLELITGNHAVVSYPYDFDSVMTMADIGFYLFHFPNRSIEQLRRKLINANRALAPLQQLVGLRDIADHWRTYYGWYMNQGDSALRNILVEHVNSCNKR